jgi:hypothetical protein
MTAVTAPTLFFENSVSEKQESVQILARNGIIKSRNGKGGIRRPIYSSFTAGNK